MTASEQLLTRAAAEGDVDAVRALLAKGINVDARTSGGQTSLMLAMIGGHEEVVQVLCAAGADSRLRDTRGLTAYDWAERRGFGELISVLRSQQANSTTHRQAAAASAEPDASFQSRHESRTDSSARAHDKTQRWLAGLKKRLQEEEERQALADLSYALTNAATDGPDAESILEIPEPLPVTQVDQPAVQPPTTEPEPALQPSPTELEPAIQPSPTEPEPALQHCTKCNEFHDQLQPCVCESTVAPRVRADITPSFLTVSSPPSHRTTIWVLIVITLAASGFITHFLYGYLSQPTAAVPATSAPAVVEKLTPRSVEDRQPVEEKPSSPALSETLAGKELNLPDPEYPATAKAQGIGGSVLVRIRVNGQGRVVAARSAEGDWHLRSAAVDAATKATFDPAKLSNRGVQGSISYTFNP